MYSSYKRIISYFANTDMEAKGKPGPDELKLLEPFRDKLAPSVFDDPYTPPVSDGSGADRTLLKQAYDLLLSAGCKRDGSTMLLPNGKPLTIEFLDSSGAHPAAYDAVHPEPRQARHPGEPAHRRPAQYKSRTEAFDYDVVTEALAGSTTPGVGLRGRLHLRGREAERLAQPRRRRRSGRRRADRDDRDAKSREELNTACRALDRVLRAGHYWVPMWYRDTAWVAYWDAFSRPERQPKLGTGAPGTWWWDEGKAKTIGL